MKKIIIISESIDVNDSSGSKTNVALIHNLHKAGFQLKVLHYTRKELQLKDIPCDAIKEQKLTAFYLLAKIQLVTQRLTKININKPIENFLGFSLTFLNDSLSIKWALENEETANFDWILTLSKGASFRSHHAVLKSPKWHDKWLAYVHDPYPFHLYPKPYDWYMPGYKQKERFFSKVSENSKHLIFPSGLLQEWMEQWFPAIKEKSVIIPHQINETFKPKENKLPAYFSQNAFTLLHAGNLMKQRPPQPLVEGFRQFLENNPQAIENAQLFLIGPANYHQEYLNKMKSEIPQVYVSDGYVEYEEVQALQNNTSVNIIIEANAEISPFLPGKFPHCVKSGMPILLLAPENSESAKLLGENYPFRIENNNPQLISLKIQHLYELWLNAKSNLSWDFSRLNDYFSIDYLKKQIENLKE